MLWPRLPPRSRRCTTSVTARAVSQVHLANTLRQRLPTVAKEFRRGVIDFRMVSTIVARTENVDDVVIADLDEAIGRHAMKWMKLSMPKLRDRIDHWVCKFDPAGVRVPRWSIRCRYLDIEASTSQSDTVGDGRGVRQYSRRRRGGYD